MDETWQPRRADWNAHVWTITTSLYESVGALDSIEWARVLCGCHIQNDWASRAMNLQSNFALSLNAPPWKLIRWFRRLQPRATGDWQLHHNKAPAHALCLMQRFLAKHQVSQVTQHPLQPRFGCLWLLAFPKTKMTFEREKISDCWWDSGKYDRVADGSWENCVRSQGAYSEGGWGIIVLCTMFLVSCIFFNKCLHTS